MLIIYIAGDSPLRLLPQRFIYKSGLSACYEVVIDVIDAADALSGHSLLCAKATLAYVNSAGEDAFVNGLVTAVDQRIDPIQRIPFYTIKIEPFLSHLALARRLRVYHSLSALEIAKTLLQPLIDQEQLGEYADFNISIPWLTAPRANDDIAFEESELHYFNQILNYARYYFKQSPDSEKLMVVDAPELLPINQTTLWFDPTRKEDVQNNSPSVYRFTRHQQAQPLSGAPRYFDTSDPEASRASLQLNKALVYEVPLYAPHTSQGFLKMKLNEQLAHAGDYYEFKGYYSNLAAGERIMIASASGQGNVAGFIESLCIEGYYQNEAWRFEVAGRIRPYAPGGFWLGAYQPRKRLPAALSGGMLQEQGQVNDFGKYQVKLPAGFNVGVESPAIQVREIQETVTRGGGASHAVSGSSHTVLLTQDGLYCDVLLCGSLMDHARPSHITPEVYRETGIKTAGGLKIHMRRSDESHAHSEMGAALADSQGNTAHFRLGANAPTLNEQGLHAHGIMSQSTGYARRVAAGNDYRTVGSPDNPITQTRLVTKEGMSVHSIQTHVGDGHYTQTYHTQATGVKVNDVPAPVKEIKPNPALTHYFYVVPEPTDLGDLADSLFGAAPSLQKDLFIHINLHVYELLLPTGVWAYVPVKQDYQVEDIATVHAALNQINMTVDEAQASNLADYGLWHQVFGWNYDNSLSMSGAFFTSSSAQINTQLSKVSAVLNKIGQVHTQSKVLSSVNTSALQAQTKILGEELHEDVSALIDIFGRPDPAFATGFTTDTGLSYNQNILGFKATGLSETEIAQLSALKIKGLTFAAAAKTAGRLGTALNGVENADDVLETCRRYGKGSSLCHETAAGDSASFVGSEMAGKAIGERAASWVGCNFASDIETLGAGIIVCTIVIGGSSIIAGTLSGRGAKIASTDVYSASSIYIHKHAIFEKK